MLRSCEPSARMTSRLVVIGCLGPESFVRPAGDENDGSLYRLKAIRRPFGDQRGAASSAQSRRCWRAKLQSGCVNFSTPDPSTFAIQIPLGKITGPMKPRTPALE